MTITESCWGIQKLLLFDITCLKMASLDARRRCNLNTLFLEDCFVCQCALNARRERGVRFLILKKVAKDKNNLVTTAIVEKSKNEYTVQSRNKVRCGEYEREGVLTMRAVVRCICGGWTSVMVVQRPLLYDSQYSGSWAASAHAPLRLHLKHSIAFN